MLYLHCDNWVRSDNITKLSLLLKNWNQVNRKQECISVGCIPTAAVAATRCQYRRVSVDPLEVEPSGGRPHWEQTPFEAEPLGGRPPNRQMLLKTLPSLASVKIVIPSNSFLWNTIIKTETMINVSWGAILRRCYQCSFIRKVYGSGILRKAALPTELWQLHQLSCKISVKHTD